MDMKDLTNPEKHPELADPNYSKIVLKVNNFLGYADSEMLETYTRLKDVIHWRAFAWFLDHPDRSPLKIYDETEKYLNSLPH